MELVWQIVGNGTGFFPMALWGFCLYRLVLPYCERARTAGLVGVSYALALLMLYVVPVEFHNVAVYGGAGLCGGAAHIGLERGNVRQKVFLVLTFFSLRWMTAQIGLYAVQEPLFAFFTWQGFLREDNWRAVVAFCAYILTSYLVQFGLLLLEIYFFHRAYGAGQDELSMVELCLLGMPSLCGLLGYGVLITNWEIYEEQTQMDYVGAISRSSWILIIYYNLFICSIIINVAIFQRVKRYQQEKLEEDVLLRQMDDMRQFVETAERHYGEVRSLRHDIGNHLQVLKDLIAEGQSGEAQSYFEKLENVHRKMGSDIKSGNPATDALLEEKAKLAEEKGICFECTFSFPADGNVDVFDMAIILGNLLDNAIEAANGDAPYIRITSKHRERFYFVEVENSFDGILSLGERTGLPRSQKGGEHGWGAINVQKTARKYLGDLQYEVEDGKVVATVMMQV